ncbi:CCHC-type domain-containing protein [Abeliophyllum distichum]|uniref:CCHC-type domain-containing protein n=1 Tax=Abeliophyllum distichum TaxID=126358 RepID=A0ABD1PMC0_9LAMI
MSDDQRVEADELAYTSIILHLSDSVLLNCFKIDPSKDLDENFDIFNKLIQDIKNCGNKGVDEYKAIILLNSIPEAYKDVKSAIKYGRDDLTIDMIINTLRSKSHELKNDRETRSNSEGLYVRGKSQHRQSNNHEGNNINGQGHKKKGKDKSISKSKVKGRKCYNCGKLGHYIKDCYKLNNNFQKNKPPEQSNVATSNTETLGELYLVCDNEEPETCVNSVSSACQFDE